MSAKTLVDRLRDWDAYADFGRIKADCAKAADEIERLEREDENAKHDIERLMDSLNKTEAERDPLEAELARLTSPEPPDSR